VAIALGVAASDAGDGDVAVYNLRGQRVKQLHSGMLDAGWKTFDWDGRAADGTRVAAGVYFVHARLVVSRFTTKLVRL
jgi:flagellar hook assembly protein FlgD